eukprot:GDKJ01002909.1.p1 GENE.GDKJ01002909.1~~GDKJ01002909.1.p1  ORF type:complete len:210 (-),score=15.82 GDKJ01002909.1:588-1217(-)
MRVIVVITLVFISMSSKSQTWSEVFRQKKTQEKYLIQQLAALKLYTGYLKKGYNIASKGINGIRSFSKGEFNLHGDFFNSLGNVNPAIASNPKITEIIKWETAIRTDLKTIKSLEGYTIENKTYFNSVAMKVSNECNQDLEELLMVISKGEVEMKDDERLKRLDAIHDRMADKFRFTRSFLNDIKMLNHQRQQDLRDSKSTKELYHIIN